ncbi:hypothetical protein [Clostridium beijerinckii]|jgi:hypothetical protein|uniref:Uncharacterized protein n=2 Tax=Clostridium beijerinckii TaxID=1520 RepID=A0A1S8PRS1_CLOBE|nr:hypothetical protein [Clostridium beijerinckii]ABR33088.1 hypothetical protein Cbei_0904 [Clostridium beijerinckii NCIMB 8052]AIU04827.1 hypothetical protein Cbs_0904 [Clostridium beijerinckii ATCC 35702]AQS03512.1 hypothetical protein CLBIJ_09270 [Clostridium beijerinckii]MBA2884768.1 hypothetical protein [Clostridium beijerinckii]MBA2899490.1 hypothetical protein [Clostridium beijerinckii]
MDELIQLRDTFKSIVTTLDQMIELGEKENKGETVDKEKQESLLGKLMFQMVKLENMKTDL